VSKKSLLIMSVFLFSIPVFAQNNELSFSVGGTFATGQTATTVLPPVSCGNTPAFCVIQRTLDSSSGVAFMGNFSRRITAFGPAAFYIEAPVIGGPGRDAALSFRSGTFLGNVLTFSATSLFFTPSAKVRFLESSRISPFATVGGGLGHLGLVGGARNTGALQFGGGVDFRSPIRHLGLRMEARDFVTGGNLTSGGLAHVSPSHQHVVFVGGGPVWRF